MALYSSTSFSAPRSGVTVSECRPSCSYGPGAPLPPVRLGKRERTYSRSFQACTASPSHNFAPASDKFLDGNVPFNKGYDIVGLGQAMVDFSGVVDPSYLSEKGVSRDGRRVISVEERGAVIDELQAKGFKLNAGGSLANTLAGCAQLGRAAYEFSGHVAHRSIQVAMAGCIGDDHLGEFFTREFQGAGVEWITAPPVGTGTGTVIVLTTPDAQRAFLSYPGTSSELVIDENIEAAITNSRVLVIEGYLWEFPNAAKNIQAAIDIAHAAGTMVALTMADATVVVRHRDAMLAAVQKCDIIFTNASEAAVLLDIDDSSARDAALQLGAMCPTCVVTDGSKGSYITALGQLHMIPAHWSSNAPVDTCGAGDAYAAGLLYGYMSGFDIRQMGEFAAHTAASVIAHQGAQLGEDDAAMLVASHTRRPVVLDTLTEGLHFDFATSLAV